MKCKSRRTKSCQTDVKNPISKPFLNLCLTHSMIPLLKSSVTGKYCLNYFCFSSLFADEIWKDLAAKEGWFMLRYSVLLHSPSNPWLLSVKSEREKSQEGGDGLEKLKWKYGKAQDKSHIAYICLNLSELCRKRHQNNLLCAKEKHCSRCTALFWSNIH